MVSEMLTGQLAEAEADKTLVEIIEGLRSRRKKMLRWGVITLVGSLIVGSLVPVSVGITVFYPDAAGLIPLLAGVTGVPLFAGLLLIIYSFFLPKASADRPSPQPTARPQTEPTTKLPPERRAEPVPSVTEHTTVKLEAPKYEASRQVVRESKETS